ncbi:hypothetical protein Pla22_36240 [Rubripirellula amarantea]|uniref:Uncharacterized protein n=1 Tax=Rubripirellula amarantea TaxID=2527999 RepID=A0A5C5WLC8_9BACT|nr:hypothetical protein Pla22_36240 [Rubripirellula amarantea]
MGPFAAGNGLGPTVGYPDFSEAEVVDRHFLHPITDQIFDQDVENHTCQPAGCDKMVTSRTILA